MNTKSHCPRSRFRRGFATMSALLMVFVAVSAVLLVANSALSHIRFSRHGQGRFTALTLAESGIDDAVQQIREDPEFPGSAGTLYRDAPLNRVPFGTYRTTVTTVAPLKRKIVSTGVNPDGSSTQVAAVVSFPLIDIQAGAMMSNGDIQINGNVTVATLPASQHVAHVISNGDISVGNNSSIDGTLSATGTVTGRGYSPSISGAQHNFVPDEALMEPQRADWEASAKAGGTTNGVRNSATITAPRYINGDITLSSSNAVTLQGTGVVYVHGNVRLTGQSTLTNGVTLVVDGTFDQAGGSTYKVAKALGSTVTPTLVVFGIDSDATDNVVSLTGGSIATQQGVVYAVNGSIKLAGGSVFVGSLLAGGEGSTIKATGNYTQLFPIDLHASVSIPGPPGMENSLEF